MVGAHRSDGLKTTSRLVVLVGEVVADLGSRLMLLGSCSVLEVGHARVCRRLQVVGAL